MTEINKGEIHHNYPHDLLSDTNEFRHVQLFVKHDTITENIKKLREKVEAFDEEKIKSAFSTSNIEPTSKEEQAELNQRRAKLSDAVTIYSCALPLPVEFVDSQGHQWSTNEGFVGRTLGGIQNAEVGVGKFNLGSLNNIIGELASVGGFRKPMVNPGYFQDYKGTEPRSFNLSWELVPSNKIDADNIQQILYHLKKYTLPTSTLSGVGMLSPFMFELKMGSPFIDNIINMTNIVCTNMEINFNNNQNYADGMPKHITLSMSFMERSTVMADNY